MIDLTWQLKNNPFLCLEIFGKYCFVLKTIRTAFSHVTPVFKDYYTVYRSPWAHRSTKQVQIQSDHWIHKLWTVQREQFFIGSCHSEPSGSISHCHLHLPLLNFLHVLSNHIRESSLRSSFHPTGRSILSILLPIHPISHLSTCPKYTNSAAFCC